MYKPFRPPLLKSSVEPPRTSSACDETGPPSKKRRTSPVHDAEPPPLLQPNQSSQLVQPRKPLLSIIRTPSTVINHDNTNGNTEAYYNVLWRKFSNKKHKTWDGDGILYVSNGYARLQDVSGRDMGRKSCTKPLEQGSQLCIAGKDVEIESFIPKDEYLAGRKFLGSVGKPTLKELDEKLRTNVKFNNEPTVPSVKSAATSKSLHHIISKTKAIQRQFKNPLLETTVVPKGDGQVPTPRHAINQPNSLVMKRPSSVPKGKQIVDVVVDPILCSKLREHQRDGVKFMYECVMGMRPHAGEGAILADEMGLGKTLQVITLLWTLLKQNPIYDATPVIKKALIVCPATLVKNWRKEIRKWLGNERIGVFVVDDKKTKLTDFTMGRSYSVMIIGYEKFRNVYEDLQKGSGIDILIADEGHRLKTDKNKAGQAIKSFATEKKIILSGTPLQNDLSEFYFMVDIVNPGLLGKPSTFKREFENPIIVSRNPGATRKQIEKGEARSSELAQLTSQFILRRTAEILSKYLPSKTEYVLLCRPTAVQASIYKAVLSNSTIGTILNSPDASLQLITVLKKLCNSPSLLLDKTNSSKDEKKSTAVSEAVHAIPSSWLTSPGTSSKLQVLDQLLHTLHSTTPEKVVIVSHYTSTLDVIGNLLTSLSYTFLRIDGHTPAGKRQDFIDKFNRTDASTYFAFLLSAKSGGMGINLIGASRLVLFDLDWNPSTDLQAMARIHRDGQKRPCKIYRLLTQGAIDEKIYQRQLTKLSLADSVVDNKVSASTFTLEDLRDLFSLDETDQCQTHELLKCQCHGLGEAVVPASILPSVDSEQDEELPELPLLLKASEVDFEAQNQRIREAEKIGLMDRDKKLKIMALMQYLHLNTSNFAENDDGQIEEMVDDDALMAVLRHPENQVKFAFIKGSTWIPSASDEDVGAT